MAQNSVKVFKAPIQTKKQTKAVVQPSVPTGKKIILENEDGTKTTVSEKQAKEVGKYLKENGPQEKLVELSQSNSVFLNSAESPLAWAAVFEACIFAHYAAACSVDIPVTGVSGLKAYCWWFMIDRLRAVDGLVGSVAFPIPDFSTVPEFPATSSIPVGVATFVEHLMPYIDRKTQSTFQYRYLYTGVPGTESAQLDASFGVGSFSYPALGNYAFTPGADPTNPDAERFWQYLTFPYLFTDVIGNADRYSSYFSSSSGYTIAEAVPYMASDATGCTIVNNNSANRPGVLCNSSSFDAEMAFIMHPAVGSARSTLYPVNLFDNFQKDIPCPWVPVMTLDKPNVAVNSGVLEMTVSYGYLTHMCQYKPGGKGALFSTIHSKFPELKYYSPIYRLIDLSAYHECQNQIMTSTYQTVLNGQTGGFSNVGDIWAFLVYTECVLLERINSYSYQGILIYNNIDVISHSTVSTAFAGLPIPAPLADMASLIAPIVQHGRMCIPTLDWRNVNRIINGKAAPNSSNLVYNGVSNNREPMNARWSLIAGQASVTPLPNLQALLPRDPLPVPTTLNNATSHFAFNVDILSAPLISLIQGNATSGDAFIYNDNAQFLTPLVSSVGGPPSAMAKYGPTTPVLTARPIIQRVSTQHGTLFDTWISPDYPLAGGFVMTTKGNPIQKVSNLTVGYFDSLSDPTTPTRGSVVITSQFTIDRIGVPFPFDRESIGRALCYSPFNETFYATDLLAGNNVPSNRQPFVQMIAGPGSPLQSVVAYSSGDGNSQFAQTLAELVEPQADGFKLTTLEAVRSIFGAIQDNLVTQFTCEVYTVPEAVIVISRAKQGYVVSPYHTEHSASSLVSFNSPSAWGSFFRGVWDVGTELLGPVVPGLSAVSKALAPVVFSGGFGSRESYNVAQLKARKPRAQNRKTHEVIKKFAAIRPKSIPRRGLDRPPHAQPILWRAATNKLNNRAKKAKLIKTGASHLRTF